MRMTMSVALPGPNGTTTLTGFDGYLSCAWDWAFACMPLKARHSANKRLTRRISSSHVRGAYLGALLLRMPGLRRPVGRDSGKPNFRLQSIAMQMRA